MAAVAVHLWLEATERVGDTTTDGSDIWPEGRWHFRDRPGSAGEKGGELARTLSLPYTGTGAVATGDAGVLTHDPERAEAGVNLYTSGHAPEVILMDMDAGLLHRWRLPFEDAFPGKRPTVETAFFRRAALLSDGDLLAIYQGGGMVRLNRRSEIVWTRDEGLYNDFHPAGDGRIYCIAKEARVVPSIHPEQIVLEDSIVVLDADGRVERRLSLLEAFRLSRFADLLEPMADSGDIFHTNTIDLLERPRGDLVPGFPAGAALISLREVDIVAVVDLATAAVLWAQRGPWDAQHQPELLDNGNLLLFDNQGASGGGSRVVELEPLSGRIEWLYPGDGDPSLSSPEAGSAQRLGNGNTLITESEAGRAIEVTAAGEIVWEFLSPHRGGSRGELVATLFEVLRLPPEAASWLAR